MAYYKRESKQPSTQRVSNFNSYFDITPNQAPIIYSDNYNISFFGFEKLQNFDTRKYGKIFDQLKAHNVINDKRRHVVPIEVNEDTLLKVHPQSYLERLKWSREVAKIIEVPLAASLPNFLIQRNILSPFRYQTGGSILGAKLAVERSWAINLGGGFNHGSAEDGGGFCAYADITLTIKYAQEKLDGIKNVMIVDLDVHQGNGHERDFKYDSTVYIMDVFNKDIYPGDEYAKKTIKKSVALRSGTEDDYYLERVTTNLHEALSEFDTDLIIYNAGTDILEKDPLGNLNITPKGIIKRDEIVFSNARRNNIPILMLISGGFRPETSFIIANSIMNLYAKNLIH